MCRMRQRVSVNRQVCPCVRVCFNSLTIRTRPKVVSLLNGVPPHWEVAEVCAVGAAVSAVSRLRARGVTGVTEGCF